LREKNESILKNLELLQRYKIVFANRYYLEFSELVAAIHNYAGLPYVDFYCIFFSYMENRTFFVVRIGIC